MLAILPERIAAYEKRERELSAQILRLRYIDMVHALRAPKKTR
jgi:hypothetical protein